MEMENLNKWYTEDEVVDLLGETNYYVTTHLREKVPTVQWGPNKYWYRREEVDMLFQENQEEFPNTPDGYRKVKASIEDRPYSTRQWWPVCEVYEVWPYSRELLSQRAKKGDIARFKVNNHYVFSVKDLRRYLLDTDRLSRLERDWDEEATAYGTFGEWKETVKSLPKHDHDKFSTVRGLV